MVGSAIKCVQYNHAAMAGRRSAAKTIMPTVSLKPFNLEFHPNEMLSVTQMYTKIKQRLSAHNNGFRSNFQLAISL